MDDLTRRVRKFIYDEIVQTSQPPIVQHVADRFGISRTTAVDLFYTLQELPTTHVSPRHRSNLHGPPVLGVANAFSLPAAHRSRVLH